MMNGTRCRSCGTFVYARNISGLVSPDDVVCPACREYDCVGAERSVR
jgi:hypothetical protein